MSWVIQGHFAVLYCLRLWIFAGKCWLVRSPFKLQSFSRLLQLNISGENKASFRSLKKDSMLSYIILRVYGRWDVLIVGLHRHFTQSRRWSDISSCRITVDTLLAHVALI